MTVEEWNALVNDAISNPSDEAKLISVLTQARDAYSDLYSQYTALEADKVSLSEENGRLKETNMNLFLRIGNELNSDTGGNKSPDVSVRSRAETITIAELLEGKEDG